MSDYKQFLSAIKRHNLSKNNLFAVEIPLPAALNSASSSSERINELRDAFEFVQTVTGTGSSFSRGLNLMCESVQIPGKAFLTSEHRTNSTQVKMPYGTLFDDIQLSFFVSSDNFERKIIDDWMSKVHNRTTNAIGYYDDYVSDIIIHKIDQRGKKVDTITVKQAYPLNITSVEANVGDSEFTKISVSFTYWQWFRGTDEIIDGLEINEDTSVLDSLKTAVSSDVLSKVYDITVGNEASLFTGEALNIYNKIGDITKKYAGVSVGEVTNMLNKVKSDLNASDRINSSEKTSLNNITNKVINKLKG